MNNDANNGSVFKNFFKYRYLLFDLVIKDLKIKYRRSVLGFAWSILNPLLIQKQELMFVPVVWMSMAKTLVLMTMIIIYTISYL